MIDVWDGDPEWKGLGVSPYFPDMDTPESRAMDCTDWLIEKMDGGIGLYRSGSPLGLETVWKPRKLRRRFWMRRNYPHSVTVELLGHPDFRQLLDVDRWARFRPSRPWTYERYGSRAIRYLFQSDEDAVLFRMTV
jgi:hypothetical protein